MRQLHPVLWNKGTFLQPQHLQYQDLYMESQVAFLVEALYGYSYGFHSLTIDDALLAGGDFKLKEASGRFRDGTLFDLTQYAPDPLPVGEFRPGEDSRLIYLAIPQRRSDKNVNLSEAPGGNTRFRADYIQLLDETTGLNKQQVQITVQNLTYLTPHHDHAGYSTLPAARLIKVGGRLQVDRNYSPPGLRIAAGSYLRAKVHEWAAMLADKSRELARTRKLRGTYNPDFSAFDVQTFWLLYTVNSYYPQFVHALAEGSIHPAEAYTQALALAGALTAFSFEHSPTDLPAYDHDDPAKSFSELGLVISKLLRTAIKGDFVVLPLTRVRGQRVWTAPLKDEHLKDSRMFLAVEMEPEPGFTIPEDFVTTSVGVVSGSEVSGLMSRMVYGLRLSRAEGAISRAFTTQTGYQYFQIEMAGAIWENVKRTRSIAVYFPEPPAKGAGTRDRKEPGLELVVALHPAS